MDKFLKSTDKSKLTTPDGKKILVQYFRRKDGENLSPEDIKEIVDNKRSVFRDHQDDYIMSIAYSTSAGWRSGEMTRMNTNAPIHLHLIDISADGSIYENSRDKYAFWDWSDPPEISISIIPYSDRRLYGSGKGGRGMGNSNHPECVYLAIVEVVGRDRPELRSQPVFHNAIGLHYNQPVPLSKMSLIEELLDLQINLFHNGELIRHSNKGALHADRTVNLAITNLAYSDESHVEVIIKNSTLRFPNTWNLSYSKTKSYTLKGAESKRTKGLCIVQGEEMCVYNHYKTKLGSSTKSAMIQDSKLLDDKEVRSQYWILPAYKVRAFLRAPEDMELIPLFNLFEEERLKIQRETESLPEQKSIRRLLYTGYNIKHCAILSLLSHRLMLFSEIDPVEAFYINKCSSGGIMWSKPYEGMVYEIDINSYYPYLMSHDDVWLPRHPGKFYTVLEEYKEMPSYGIYRISIDKSEANDSVKFLRTTPGYYTYLDICNLLWCGCRVFPIIDGQPNAMCYDADALFTAKTLFGDYISTMYSLKQKGCKLAKPLMNVLWGALCEKDRHFEYSGGEGELIVGKDGFNVDFIQPVEKGLSDYGTLKVSYTNRSRLYKHEYARIGPFLTAFARHWLFWVIHNHTDKIVRVHTDGVYTSEPLIDENVTIGDGLGEWKYGDNNGKVCRITTTNRPVIKIE
jgi:hypothetical protein